MTSTSIKVVFPVILDTDHCVTQIVRLGGVFPEIEIQRLNDLPGTHYFKIVKNIPHCGIGMIGSAVAEAENQIDHFWNILAYIRNIKIKPTGQVYYELNENLIEFNPPPRHLSVNLTVAASEHWL